MTINIIFGMFFAFLLIIIVYIMDFFEAAIYLGLPCGVIIASVTCCDTLKRTFIARVVGVLSALITQFLFTLSGIPYALIMFIYRDNEWLQYSDRLSVNETIGYGWGRMFLLGGMLISFAVSVVGIFIFNVVKKHRILSIRKKI